MAPLYRINNEFVRPALLETLRTAPFQPGWFQWLRHIFKIAELRRDAEVFGLLAYRFEVTRSTFANTSYSYYYGGQPPPKKTIGPKAEKAFAHETRFYFRRRVWRTLYRLGELGDVDYVPMAVGVLLPFSDDDAKPARQEVRYDWSSYQRGRGYQTTTIHWDRYAAYWAFCQILYANSPRYAADEDPPYQHAAPLGAKRAGRSEANYIHAGRPRKPTSWRPVLGKCATVAHLYRGRQRSLTIWQPPPSKQNLWLGV